MSETSGGSPTKKDAPADFRKTVFVLIAMILGCLIIYLLTFASTSTNITITLMITYIGIVFWITELIPFALSSIFVLILYVFTNVASTEQILSGYASGAVFLIVSGMMIAQGVHSTSFGKRVVYFFLKLTSHNFRTLLLGIILIPQILAVFIPATGVRTALILPIILSLIPLLKLENSTNQKKQMMLAVAFGSNISGIGFLPAAIGNILVVEIIYMYANVTVSYFDWLLYTLPIWLLSIPFTWLVVATSFKGEKIELGNVRQDLSNQLEKLGPITSKEKRCIAILVITVALWMTQGIHGFHPAIPALFAVILMGLPFIGITHWNKLAKIDVSTFLLVGATLSIGRVLVETGSIEFLSSILFTDQFISMLVHPLILILFITILVQVLHLALSNVSTAVVTIVPVVIALANSLSMDPVMLSITAGVASLLGFILVVETIPNVLVYSTGHLKQRDFFKPGILLTIYTSLIIVIVAATWWNWLGFY